MKTIGKFLQTIPGKRIFIPMDIDSNIDYSGDFKKLSHIDVIISNLSRIFLISKGTYYQDPDFGTGLYKYVFAKADIPTKVSIEQEIADAIRQYEDRAKINFEILFFKNRKGFKINLYVEYNGEKKDVSVNIDESLLG